MITGDRQWVIEHLGNFTTYCIWKHFTMSMFEVSAGMLQWWNIAYKNENIDVKWDRIPQSHHANIAYFQHSLWGKALSSLYGECYAFNRRWFSKRWSSPLTYSLLKRAPTCHLVSSIITLILTHLLTNNSSQYKRSYLACFKDDLRL